jgi:competence protein ComEA
LFGGGLVAGIIAASIVLGLLRQARPAPIFITPAPPPATASPSPSAVMVYVSGEVAKPAVYAVPTGGRVADAVRQAGGFTSAADQAAVNLVLPLSDGLHVHVPSLADAVAIPVISGPGATGPGAPAGRLNLNTATAEELQALPEIGPVMAEAIVAYREQNGPFSAVDDLLDVPGIGPGTFEAIAELVTVR